jgi:hypothetical protein
MIKTEKFRVVWKYIRWEGQGRTPQSYCTYIIKNKTHEYKLKVREGHELFKLLKETRIGKDEERFEYSLYIDVVYKDDKFWYITNYRKL